MPAGPQTPPHIPTDTPSGTRMWLCLVALLTVALCWPFRESVGWLGDEGVLLHGADRMLRGDRIYTDFFEFLPPFGFVLVAAWLKLAGISFGAARWLAILTIAAIACLVQDLCRRVTSNPRASAMAALAWVLTSQGAWTQVSHHWFTTLFSLLAFWAVLRQAAHGGALPSLLAGIAAGAAGMTTSTRGILAALATAASCATAGRRLPRFVLLACGLALVPGLAVLYLAAQGSLAAAFNGVIVFPATRYSDIQPVHFGRGTSLQNVFLALLFPVSALLAIALCLVRGRAAWRDRRFLPCISFALAGFIGCYPRPDIAHITFTTPLALPLFLLCARELAPRMPRLPRTVGDILAGGLLAIAVLSYAHAARENMSAPPTAMPRGSVKLMHGTQDAWAVLAGNIPAHAADGYLFYPYSPLLPFLAGLRHVAPYDVYTPNYSTPGHYEETCRVTMDQATWLVIDRSWTRVDRLIEIFPRMSRTLPAEVLRLESALETAYAPAAEAGNFQLRRRLPGITAAACGNAPR